MVQTNQLVSQLNVSVKPQVNSKSAKSDDSKSAFSEALDKKLSSQDKASDDNSKTLKTSDKEKGQVKGKDAESKQPKTDETQNVQQEPQQTEKPVAADDSWLMQALVVQQSDSEIQDVVPVVETEEMIPQVVDVMDAEPDVESAIETASISQIPQETVQSGNVVQKDEAKDSKADTNPAAEMKSAIQTEQPVQATAHTQNNGQQHAQMNSQNQSQQTDQTKDVKPVEHSVQGVSQNGQTAVTNQMNPETPQAAQGQTVDMSNPKEGVPNLAKSMSEQINQGKNAFEIWLEPANLGKIGVKVAYEGGRAMIQILCMSSKAMEIVGQNAKTLGAIIQQNTGTNTLVVVEQPERQDYLQQEAGRQNRGDEQQKEQKKEKETNEEDTETQSFLHQLRLGLK